MATATQESTTSALGERQTRLEDDALLRGLGQYADDLATTPGTLQAAVLRSPHAHARLVALDAGEALAMPGVHAVLTGADVQRWAAPLPVGVRQPMEHWCLAVDRVRYVGEPVAVVVADSRYLAEDALDAIRADYEVLDAVVATEAAVAGDAPVLHEAVGSNVVNDRSFSYGEPDRAFREAARHVSLKIDYPRNSCTPIECYVVVARYDPADGGYDVAANFQGPFALHSVMARALKVSGAGLRLRTPPDSGGSFGIKQGVLSYVVLMALAARKAGAPVKWVEDRLEHLQAASSATNRVTTIEAAVAEDGRIQGLRYDQLDDCGAYLRAPEPATFYRMHGTLTGAYAVRNLAVRNRVVLTNKTPSGLNRGFGGPQVYFALERLVQHVAVELGLDPLTVILRNLIPADAFPYRAPAGSLLDSGNYHAAVELARTGGGLQELEERRAAARAAGRYYGIGFAAVVEPSISNMGYITTAMTPEERRRAGPKNGAVSTATLTVDPLGSVSVQIASVPQGQGHRTAAAQVVADVLGVPREAVSVHVALDTGKDAWSIASGNYSSRFAGAVAGAVHKAATRARDRLARIAAAQMGADPGDLVFADGRIHDRNDPARSLSFHRAAGAVHWSPGLLPEDEPGGLRETAFWSPPELAAPDDDDRINSSLCYGFVFDYCGVDIDPVTGRVTLDRYVTTHDAGRLLNPDLVDGQIRGGFAQAVGAALYEELAYGDDGSFRSGTLADYLIPTAAEVPEPVILHQETPSPFTPLGAKGVGEGNNMSTPVCIANAVADALGQRDIRLPLTPSRVREMIGITESEPPAAHAAPSIEAPAGGSTLRATGVVELEADADTVYHAMLDPGVLSRIIPGCHALEQDGDNAYRADVTVGVGLIKARFEARVSLTDLDPPHALRLNGAGSSAVGTAEGGAAVRLSPREGGGTQLAYDYQAAVTGKVASVGARMLQGASRVVVDQIFARLRQEVDGPGASAGDRAWGRRFRAWLLRLLGRGGAP
ncbi:molybdopterin-dependent oxidoreductase [Aquisalimonas lutea]|uniref:molybdopterin cofactor-binding domain-containing protein n=1 Tax=Aquisalimonas lutea TaxID=1327750 RepID=UPI0025B42895|nr:molybdopterin cofactor-binding domain-containing protein [Aquisalimonas lutea]MDN3516537.1 molybdopterin-dependent oxidoreductase [Aquisalimonas lutea]